MRLGELIAVARECKGWTLRELERASGVSNALISQIETGKVKDPGFFTVVRLLDALGVSLDRAASADRRKLDVLREAGVFRPPAKPREEAARAVNRIMRKHRPALKKALLESRATPKDGERG